MTPQAVQTDIHRPTDASLLWDGIQAIDLLRRVMDQTERRVFKGEQVPASEKIVSLVEHGNPADSEQFVPLLERHMKMGKSAVSSG